ncbi:MAG: hypothetical protein P1V20_17450 [Verrucomicrobiales bacterium]|nr:hypothetical protein [Verrucomicrobiales bacterium]
MIGEIELYLVFLGFSKLLITFTLAIYLIGGGEVCLHKVVSLFHHECHCEHHHDHDHEESKHCPGDGHPEGCTCVCGCALEGFDSDVPAILRLREPLSLPIFTSNGTHTVAPAIAALYNQPRWEHPPPPLIYRLSLPLLQRYNV